MNPTNEKTEPRDNMELLREEATECAPGCACHGNGALGRVRWVLGAIILLVTAGLVVRGLTRSQSKSSQDGTPAFKAAKVAGTKAAPVAQAQAAAATSPDAGTVSPAPKGVSSSRQENQGIVGKELSSLSDLNTVAADTNAVFVYVPAEKKPAAKLPSVPLEKAMGTLSKQGLKIALFTLKTSAPEYAQMSAQMSLPGVLAMVKGKGMSAVSGDITETKLVQGFVAASNAGGCGPSGCGPSGCGQ